MLLAPAWNADFGFTVVCLHLSLHQAEGPPGTHLLSFLCLWPVHSWHSSCHLGRGSRPSKLRNLGNRGGHSPAGLGVRLIEGISWWRWGLSRASQPGVDIGKRGRACLPRGLRSTQHQPYLLAPLVTLAGTAGPGLLLLLISPAFMRGRSGLLQRNVEECRPVCTRKPKLSPRGVARWLEEKPHFTWADTGMRPGREDPGVGSRPRASHAAFSRVLALASQKPDSREMGRGEGSPVEQSWGLSLCVHTPAASPKSSHGGFRRDCKD